MPDVQEAVGHEAEEGRRKVRVVRVPRRERVLVVLRSNGWVEVYARRTVDVRVVNRIHATGDSETAHALDRLVELQLPKCYRRLYFPVRLRGAGQVRKVTPEQALATLHDLDLLRAVQTPHEDMTEDIEAAEEP
jgi:hypothetical protein